MSVALKASPEDQQRLLDLQALDTRAQQLAHRERNLPESARVDEIGARHESARAALAERRGTLEDTQAELARVESDVALVEARIARDSERLQATSSVKDVAALEQELASLRKRLDDLEEIELAVMERVEEQQSAFSNAEEQLEELAAELADARSARDAALETLHAERDAVHSDRGALVERLPGELVALYERQRERYGVGASHLRGGVSSASGVALTGADIAAVRAAAPDDVILCPDSNAILVRTAESGL